MKKIIFIILLISLFFFSAPIFLIEAGDPSDQPWCEEIPEKDRTGGLVPCGRSCGDPTTPEDEAAPCQLCDFFVMIDTWFDGLLTIFAPVMAALMIAIGGGMYIFAFGDPEKISRAKKLFTAVVIGLVIIYGAWFILGLFLEIIGLNPDWTLPFYRDWWEKGAFEIPCP